MTAAPRRVRLGVRWWHKWIGIATGMLLIIWIISGLIMLLPPTSVAVIQPTRAAVDWSRVAVSPAQAAATAGGTIQRVELQRLVDLIVYVVRLDARRTVLIDASTGAPVQVTRELATSIAREPIPELPVSRVDRIDQAELMPTGTGRLFPAFHVVFGDAAGTEAYVSERTGEVVRSQGRDRWQSSLGHGLHVFSSVSDLPGGNRTRIGTLWFTGLVALVSVVTGYWLALPRRWRGSA